MNNTLTLAIVGQLVGDYLLQTDWMAQNKKLRSWPCLVHCVIWTACVCIFAGWSWRAGAFLFACHFAQDRTQIVKWWMCLKSPGFTQPPFAPWSLIVVDNVWHFVQLWVAWRFIA
jgi:hypothetical protein